MNVTIDKTKFEEVCYSATSATSAVYDGVLPYIQYVDKKVSDVLGTVGIAALSTNEDLESAVIRYDCLQGYADALRHLDLVLTDSGFGVVSNDHQTPASKDRVDSLNESLLIAADMAYCDILACCATVTDWGSQNCARRFMVTPLYHLDEASRLMGKQFTHKDWLDAKRAFYDGWFLLSYKCGLGVLTAIMQKVRTNDLTDDEKVMIEKLQVFLAMYASHRGEPMMHAVWKDIVRYMDENTDLFPGLTDSSEYKARHMERYENTKESTAYFFG